MTANFYQGQGSKLKLKISGSYVSIGTITNLSSPTQTVVAIPTKNMDSVSETFIPSRIIDSGEVDVEYYFDPASAGQAGVEALINTPVMASWQIALPTADDEADWYTKNFDGILVNWNLAGITPDELMLASAKIRTSGSVETPAP